MAFGIIDSVAGIFNHLKGKSPYVQCGWCSVNLRSPPLHASRKTQWFFHGSMLDIAPDGIDANTCGVSEHLLNRDMQTVTEADAKQTAMQRTQSRIAVEV